MTRTLFSDCVLRLVGCWRRQDWTEANETVDLIIQCSKVAVGPGTREQRDDFDHYAG